MRFHLIPRLALLLVFTLMLSACDSDNNQQQTVQIDPARTVAESDYTTTASGLKYYDFKTGSGNEAAIGTQLVVRYTGWLTSGEVFDSTKLRNDEPILFILGNNQVIAGWEQGLEGMKVGGERQLVIPPSLGYGSNSVGNIPPNSTLIFEVEMVNVIVAEETVPLQ